MAIQKEFWVDYIIPNLFKVNPHFSACFRDDQYTVGGRLVHIPQAGAPPEVVKNRTTFPATAVQRTDVDLVYILEPYTSTPTYIQRAEELELSYNKIDSVIGEHISILAERAGDEINVNWLEASTFTGSANIPAAPVIRTSGPAVLATKPGATGNRKRFMRADLLAARTRFNKDNVPASDRYVLLSSDMMTQLMEDEILNNRDSALELNLRTGALPQLYGFTLLERPTTATYTNAATPVVKAFGAATAAADNDCAIVFHRNSVAMALGEVDFFEKQRDPLYYGDVYSALVRMGGRKRRVDTKGVLAIVQDASA